MNLSLKKRVSLFSIVIPICLTFFVSFVYWSFTQSLENLQKNRLETYLYELLALADFTLPKIIPDDENFKYLQSLQGLSSFVKSDEGEIIWGESYENEKILPLVYTNKREALDQVGHLLFDQPYNSGQMRVSLSVDYEDKVYIFEVAQSIAVLQAETKDFTYGLVGGAIAISFVIFGLIGLITYLVIKPLTQVTKDLEKVKQGDTHALSSNYPDELNKLTSALTRVLDENKAQLDKYRKSVGNLAHSLKTPVAIILSKTRDLTDLDTKNTLEQQAYQIDENIKYYLNKARSAGGAYWHTPLAVQPEIKSITDAYKRLHIEKTIAITTDVTEDAAFIGDKGDFLQIVGNIVNNAFKYTSTQIYISAKIDSGQLVIIVADDGPGIPSEQWGQATKRGMRLDNRPIGHGIGLSEASDLVAEYRGSISLINNAPPLKGCCIEISLPSQLMT